MIEKRRQGHPPKDRPGRVRGLGNLMVKGQRTCAASHRADKHVFPMQVGSTRTERTDPGLAFAKSTHLIHLLSKYSQDSKPPLDRCALFARNSVPSCLRERTFLFLKFSAIFNNIDV